MSLLIQSYLKKIFLIFLFIKQKLFTKNITFIYYFY